MKASWRTTTAGLVVVALGLGTIVYMLAADKTHVETMGIAASLVAVGVGLLNARDDKVSSERARAK